MARILSGEVNVVRTTHNARTSPDEGPSGSLLCANDGQARSDNKSNHAKRGNVVTIVLVRKLHITNVSVLITQRYHNAARGILKRCTSYRAKVGINDHCAWN